MRIDSEDRKSQIEILRIEDGEYSSYTTSCSVDIGHGQFSAKNTDIQILNLEAFIQDFNSFVLSRDVRPKLEGTYNTFLEFFKAPSSNSVMLKFVVGDSYYGYSESVDYRSSGAFEIEQEYLNKILAEFRALV